MVGAIGPDAHASTSLNSFDSYGADVSEVVRTEANSEYATTDSAIVMVEKCSVQNRIIISSEQILLTNQAASPQSSIQVLVSWSCSWKFLRTPSCRLSEQQNPPTHWFLNPALAATLPEEAYLDLARAISDEIEIALLAQITEAELKDISMLGKGAADNLAKGVQNIVVTLGARGAYYACQNGQSDVVPALDVDVVDATAADDTFIGMYPIHVVEAASRSKTSGIEAAIRSSIAALSITASSSDEVSIPWEDELESRLCIRAKAYNISRPCRARLGCLRVAMCMGQIPGSHAFAMLHIQETSSVM